jgi:hypothetical protein
MCNESVEPAPLQVAAKAGEPHGCRSCGACASERIAVVPRTRIFASRRTGACSHLRARVCVGCGVDTSTTAIRSIRRRTRCRRPNRIHVFDQAASKSTRPIASTRSPTRNLIVEPRSCNKDAALWTTRSAYCHPLSQTSSDMTAHATTLLPLIKVADIVHTTRA